MPPSLTGTRLATLILIAALGALPVIAALPVRAGDLGQFAVRHVPPAPATLRAAGQFTLGASGPAR